MTTETDTTEDAAAQEPVTDAAIEAAPTEPDAPSAPSVPATSSPAASGTRTLRIFADLEIARAQVIRRAPLSEPKLSEAVQAGIDELWGEPTTPALHVAKILDAVAREGDAAVARFSQRFDGSAYERIEVSSDEIAEAFEIVSPEDRAAIEFTVNRVRRYHQTQMEHAPTSFTARGTGMLVRPLQRVGVYMTGSDAALPSSVIHTAIPAVVAGVDGGTTLDRA
ncbi:MAG: histidinol dehydrogenase, partial [Chloroflexota bacterium]